MADLNTDIRYVKGVGETRAKAFEKLGVFTLGDLIAVSYTHLTLPTIPADGKTVRSSTLSGTYRRGSTPAARP